MFFSRNKDQSSVDIFSIVDGEIVPPHTIHATSLPSWKGCHSIIRPENDTIFAPCDGEILLVDKEKHTITLLAENKCVLMIHVDLPQNEHVEMLTGVHDHVFAGTPLLSYDLLFDKEENTPVLIMMQVLDQDGIGIHTIKEKGHVQANKDILFRITNRPV